MQPNFPNRNTSNLIKNTEAAKKKARRRLIGSVFMLLVALIILLNVTARVKPIPVNPKTIEIANGSKNISSSTVATSAPINAQAHIASSAAIMANKPAASAVTHQMSSQAIASESKIASEPIATGFKAGVVGSEHAHDSNITHSPKLNVTPKIISETNLHKPNPEDILNGHTTTHTSNNYFIQFVASGNKQNINVIKDELQQKGIKVFIQPIKAKNGVMYRLRMGPAKTEKAANDKLSSIQAHLGE